MSLADMKKLDLREGEFVKLQASMLLSDLEIACSTAVVYVKPDSGCAEHVIQIDPQLCANANFIPKDILRVEKIELHEVNS